MTLKRDPKELLKIMGLMAELEMKISEFYRECGDSWRQEKEFWSGLEKDEVSHAQCIRKMADILRARPERFEENRPFNAVALAVTLDGVQKNLQKLKRGELGGLNLLSIARDMEKSLLESKPGEFLKSRDPEYQDLFSVIIGQTKSHQRTLDEKIEEVKKKAAGPSPQSHIQPHH